MPFVMVFCAVMLSVQENEKFSFIYRAASKEERRLCAAKTITVKGYYDSEYHQ